MQTLLGLSHTQRHAWPKSYVTFLAWPKSYATLLAWPPPEPRASLSPDEPLMFNLLRQLVPLLVVWEHVKREVNICMYIYIYIQRKRAKGKYDTRPQHTNILKDICRADNTCIAISYGAEKGAMQTCVHKHLVPDLVAMTFFVQNLKKLDFPRPLPVFLVLFRKICVCF